MDSELGFECPNCTGLSLEEVSSVDGTISSTLTMMHKNFGWAYDGAPTIEGDIHILRYQCSNCGWVVPDVDNPEDLFKWLESQNYNKE